MCSSLIVSMCVYVPSYFRGEESIWCVSIHVFWWGEYVLDMHYIFSQNSPSFWAIGGRMSSGLRALAMHLTKVSLGKALVRMPAMLRLVGTWCILMSPFCKWSCSHLILRSTCLVLEFPGLMLFVHIVIVERLSSNMLTLLWRSHAFQLSWSRDQGIATARRA